MFSWFSFKKKELEPISFSILGTDIHSHLIPAIDDGSPDLETSINLIKELMNLGYHKIITTPHVMSDFYQNDSTIILKGLKSLSDEIKNQSIDIELLAAAEYYVDFDFEAKISKEEFLTFGDNYILIELSFAEPPPNLYDIIFKLQLEKYKVILAHPERYMYFGHDEYQDLVNRGVFLQINALSMIGYYSPIVRKKTEELINNDFVSFVGTDCHNIEHARLYKKCQKSRLWHNLISRNTLLNHTL